MSEGKERAVDCGRANTAERLKRVAERPPLYLIRPNPVTSPSRRPPLPAVASSPSRIPRGAHQSAISPRKHRAPSTRPLYRHNKSAYARARPCHLAPSPS